MYNLPPATTVISNGEWDSALYKVLLTYDARFVRRKRLRTTDDAVFNVDVAHTTHLNDGDAFQLADGTLVEIIAAQEDILTIRGPSLTRLAWHIGNRHTPAK